MTVQPGAFAIGMEIRDILWPPTCTLLSVDRKEHVSGGHGAGCILEGDVLHLHYLTYDPDESLELLTRIIGEQERDLDERTHESREGHHVPMVD
jgi:hypothetical protein